MALWRYFVENPKETKETNWEECLFYKTARKVTPDLPRARFLRKTSSERIKDYLEKIPIQESNADFIFEGYYSSLIELLQAITISQGYNIINHLCLGYYLRDILKRQDLYRIFDSCRFKRNGLIYYGKRMEFEMAKFSIEQAKKLIGELKSLLNQKL